MIGVDPGLIRSTHARRVSAAPEGMGGGNNNYQPAPARGGGMMHHAHDTTDPQAKLQIIENLLSSSPPLPAPPLMQQSAILAQERELEQQMNRLHLHKQQHPQQHRPSVTALTIDPVYTVVAPPAQPAKSALSAQLQPRMAAAAAAAAATNASSQAAAQSNNKQTNNAAATSDWFAKVDVAPRAAPVASSFVPSSLSAALNDSGLLFRQQAGGGRGGDDFARVSTRDARGGASNKSTKGRLPDISSHEDTFTIFLHPFSDVRVRPARIRLQLPSSQSGQGDSPPSTQANVQQCNPTSDEIVANLLEKWSSGELAQNFGLRANLNPAVASKDKWCLRMVDEDTVGDDDDDDDDQPSNTPMKDGEEIGMPEEDLPPLERNKPIRMFGAQVLAMTVTDGVEHKMTSLQLSAATNSPPTSPVAAGRPASPSTASPPPAQIPAAATNAPTTPSSRNPASSQQQIRRYDTMRITPTHATASAASKMRTVSVFSGMTSLLDSNGQVVTSPSRADNRAYSVETSGAGGPTSPVASEKVYLKVHIGDHETHVVPLLKSQLLADALPIVSAKKHALVAMKAEHYRFSYVDPLLSGRNEQLKDMSRITVGQLASDELNLAPRSVGEQGTTAGGLGATTPNLLANKAEMNSSSIPVSHLERGSIMIPTEAPSLSSFQFTMDTASNYTEYKVIKTNQRGKRQHRIFGIDRFKIYNKTQSGADEGESGGMFSFISKLGVGDQGVSRAQRMINTIASVHVVSLRPTCFCISFKADSRKDSPIAQTREYETETKMEAAEIVAKLRFLMAHSLPDHSNATSSVANAGLLSQSIK